MPSARVPIIDKQGRVNTAWFRFFNDLWERTGGGAEDLVEEGAGDTAAAQAAADAAAASAQIAQDLADELDRRIDFDFDFDLR